MRTHVLALSLALLPCFLAAQGAPILSGKWQIGGIIPETFNSTCKTPLGAVAESGIGTFRPGGTWEMAMNVLEVCPGASCTTSTSTANGTYQVRTDGTVIVDEDPGVPGQDLEIGLLRPNGSVLVFSRWDEEEDEPGLYLAVALSSGHSSTSLSGAYGFARLVLRNDASGLALRGDEGTLTFDGQGTFAESSTQHTVLWNGSATQGTPFSASGIPYRVAGDGTVRAAGGIGAVSADGELVYWVRQSCPEVELTIAVRKPTAVAYADGDFRIGSVEADVGRSWLESDWGTVTLDTRGSLVPNLVRISTFVSATGTASNSSTWLPDTYTVTQSGRLTLFAQATQRLAVPGWVSRDGSMLVGAPWMPAAGQSSPGAGLLLGVARCACPAQVGNATAGSGGIQPVLLSIGGYPYAGNATFGYVVAAGLGGASGVLALSRGALQAGLPVGGVTIWVDPAQLVGAVPLMLSPGGPGAGAAGWPLPLPATPLLGGVQLAAQAFLLDPGAAYGLSATGALGLTGCR